MSARHGPTLPGQLAAWLTMGAVLAGWVVGSWAIWAWPLYPLRRVFGL